MSKSKVLVVGGTGYIGRRIVKASLAQGHETYVLQRPEIGLDIEKLQMLLSFKKQGAHLVQASFSDHRSLVDAIKLADVVICAMSGVHFRSHNLLLQLKLVEAIKDAGNIRVSKKSNQQSKGQKFCYYNNYNLSQPCHFYKSCRKYWTKGGILRNVPVGGGCRKSKRSSKPKTSSPETSGTLEPQVPPSQPAEQERKSNSHSSSESSSLTAAIAATTTEVVSAPSSNNLLDVQESKLFMNQSGKPSFEMAGVLEQGGDCGGIFSEIGTFSSLINSLNEALPAFGFGNIPDALPFRFSALQGNDQWLQQQKVISNRGDHQELKLPEITGGSMLDQTVFCPHHLLGEQKI